MKVRIVLVASCRSCLIKLSQYVEFAGGDVEGEDEDGIDGYDVSLPNPNAEKANSHQAKSLEALLALKNKRIADELAKFRVLHDELETSLRVTEEKLASSDAELNKQKALNERLENDLLHLEQHKQEPSTSRDRGDDLTSSSVDLLADLDLGSRRPTVRTFPLPIDLH